MHKDMSVKQGAFVTYVCMPFVSGVMAIRTCGTGHRGMQDTHVVCQPFCDLPFCDQ